jgi:glucose dehydrogenase
MALPAAGLRPPAGCCLLEGHPMRPVGLLALSAVVIAAACGSDGGFDGLESSRAAGGPPEPLDLDQLAADDGQWAMAAKNYASTRFSGLTEITVENVSRLQLAWTFSTGVLRATRRRRSSSETRCT